MNTRDITVFVRLYAGGTTYAPTEDEIEEETFFDDIVPSDIGVTAFTECRYKVAMALPAEGKIVEAET